MPTTVSRPVTNNTPKPRRKRQSLKHQRCQALINSAIDFIPNEQFWPEEYTPDPEVDAVLKSDEGSIESIKYQPGHLRRLCEKELLTHAQESALFREMNYAKCRADHLCSWLDPASPSVKTMNEIEALLGRAELIRDHIDIFKDRIVNYLAEL